MSKRNKTKLTWKEMNVKQRIFFVLDWIMRGVLIVTLALFVIAFVMNCAGYGSDDDSATPSSVAYADEGYSLYSSDIRYITYSDNFSSVFYNNFSGTVSSIDVNSIYFGVNLRSFPSNTVFTCVLYCYTDFPANAELFISYLSTSWFHHGFLVFGDFYYFTLSLPDSYSYFSFGLQSLSSIFSLPFSYNFDVYFYPGEYNPGFAQGLAAGIVQGREEGINSVTSAQSGIFYNSKLSADVTYYDNVTDSTYNKSFSDLIPNLGYNSVLFDSTYNYIASQRNSTENDNVKSVSCTINLSQPFSYNSERPFYISGSSRSDIFDITLIDINGNRYSGSFDSDQNYFAFFPSSSGIDNAAAISSIVIYFGRADDTMSDASLTHDSGGYFQGYNVGLNNGYNNGFSDGRAEGIDIGFDEGYQSGFNQAGAGGFSWLISSVQSFLNTPFFGTFGIGTLLYIALGVTFVMLFLKFFAGG